MIGIEWRETGAPCDSCGMPAAARLVVTLTNKKAEMGYGLPDLSLCAPCRYGLEREFRQKGLVDPPKEGVR